VWKQTAGNFKFFNLWFFPSPVCSTHSARSPTIDLSTASELSTRAAEM
jgi:hypothetical protein